MKLSIRNIFFSLVMLIYLAVPFYLIGRYENVLRNGEIYRFRLRPVDPYDAFRGKYVALSYIDDGVSVSPADSDIKAGMEVYISVAKDNKGFAVLKNASLSPSSQSNYFKANVYTEVINDTGTGHNVNSRKVYVTIPFDRFYVNEPMAEQAESSYRNGARDSSAYAEIAIKDGKGVVKELYIQGRPLVEYLKDGSKK